MSQINTSEAQRKTESRLIVAESFCQPRTNGYLVLIKILWGIYDFQCIVMEHYVRRKTADKDILRITINTRAE